MLNYKENDRLLEIVAAAYLNNISNFINKRKFKDTIVILTSLVEVVDSSYREMFFKLLDESSNEKLLGASKKELYAALKVFYKKKSIISKKLNLSYNTFKYRYADLIDRDFITDDFINSLEPVFIKSEKERELCKLIVNFLDNFHYLVGENYFEYYDHPRTLEIEFYIIYQTLVEVIRNNAKVEQVIYNICNQLGIEWSHISYLLRNLINIERSNQPYGEKQFKSEIFNLYYLKGFNKAEIGKYVLKSNTNYYAPGYNNMTKDITNDEFNFGITYTPTIEWNVLDKSVITRFISLFDNFVNADL